MDASGCIHLHRPAPEQRLLEAAGAVQPGPVYLLRTIAALREIIRENRKGKPATAGGERIARQATDKAHRAGFGRDFKAGRGVLDHPPVKIARDSMWKAGCSPAIGAGEELGR